MDLFEKNGQADDASIEMSAEAYYNLGVMYEDQENEALTLENYRAAADMGFAKAQSRLGSMYEKGILVDVNKEEAVRWYRMAAEQGDVTAQFNLGYMYYNGEGCEKNIAEAMIWIGKAADQGDEAAREFMAVQKKMENKNQTAAAAEKRKKELIRSIPAMEEIYALYCLYTRSPFLLFNARKGLPTAFLFYSKASADKRAEELAGQGYRCQSMKIDKKDRLRFMSDLYFYGAQNILFETKDGPTEVLLMQIAAKADMSKVPAARRPIENPKLQTCLIYYAQDLRKKSDQPINDEIRKKMDQSLGVTMAKAKFILPCLEKPNPVNPGKKLLAPIFLQNKEKDKKLLPLFSDTMEFSRFNKDRRFGSMVVDCAALVEMEIVNEADFYVINPIGVNFPVNKNFVKAYVDAVKKADAKKAEAAAKPAE